jgi:hypothetical protein
LDHALGIRRITATPLHSKAENWRLEIPETTACPAIHQFNSLDFRLGMGFVIAKYTRL